VNRMGFNNSGAEALAERLRALGPLGVPLGISLGKSRATPLADAAADYAESYARLRPYGDYFAVNVSSPNTPGLRELQDRGALGEILAALRGDKPILVKIAPDLTRHAISDVLDVCAEHGVAGLIATNTTLARDGIVSADSALADQAGGLSGRPLASRALDVVRFVAAETGGKLPVIGVGGVDGPESAMRMVDAGASLVQVYSGLVYRGPGMVRRINRALRSQPLVAQEGVPSQAASESDY
ncbi:MAG: quinone-dependent dihydroorotate dehydrogenase, partial [Longispora sp.]|nr:quinone-dependent dihydroorotate dehydrogenase [Longispora sp. (in: high G+C Gram-positive bacteria)]